MKTQAIILLVLIVGALATTTKTNSKLNSLLQAQAQAGDAVDSALDLLKSLQQQNVDSQQSADEQWKINEPILQQRIVDLTALRDQNQKNANDATAQRQWFDQEIVDTQNYLTWNDNRVKAIQQKSEELQEQRCYSNNQFILKLKEHSDALKIIALLKRELTGFTTTPSLTQIKTASQKLKMFSHLFNENALSEFNQLSQYAGEPNVAGPQGVDSETAQWDSKATDNSDEFKGVAATTNEKDSRGILKGSFGDKLQTMLTTLEEHLHQSILDLQRNEIQAALDLAEWLTQSEEEIAQLRVDSEQKKIYLDKTEIQQAAAVSWEEKQIRILQESQQLLETAQADLLNKTNWYNSEKSRREGENALLAELVEVFVNKVNQLAGRNYAN